MGSDYVARTIRLASARCRAEDATAALTLRSRVSARGGCHKVVTNSEKPLHWRPPDRPGSSPTTLPPRDPARGWPGAARQLPMSSTTMPISDPLVVVRYLD